MKIFNLKHVALSFAALGILHSCDDFLDVKPESFVTPETFFEDNSQLNAGLVGVYDGMQNAYSDFNFITDFRSDTFSPSPVTTNVTRTAQHNSTFDPGEGFLSWRDLYRTIDRANRVIIAGEALSGVDTDILGQAYAIRSKLYFDMIRVWENVPLFTKPVSTPGDAFIPVTSFDVIMNTIVIPDMLRAETLIETVSSPFNFSRASVYAHQAEVYMWQNENMLAKEAIEDLIALNVHSLVTTPQAWQDLFINQVANTRVPDGPGKVQTGPELILSIRYDDSDNTASGVMSAYASGGSITVISPLVEEKWIERFPVDTTWNTLYPDTPPVFSAPVVQPDGSSVIEPVYGDWRQFASRQSGAFTIGLGNTRVGEARLFKWQKDPLGLVPNLDRTDIALYRYADMILLLAEAELKLDNAEGARTLLNQLRTARQLPLVTEEAFGTTMNEQLNYILDERQFELMGEGKRWWDLRRNNKALETINPVLQFRNVATPLTEQRLIFPIFTNHLVEAQGAYTQNLGW